MIIANCVRAQTIIVSVLYRIAVKRHESEAAFGSCALILDKAGRHLRGIYSSLALHMGQGMPGAPQPQA